MQGPCPDVGVLRPGEALPPNLPRRNFDPNLIRQNGKAYIGCICCKYCGCQEKEQEIVMIPIAYTIVDEYAVMIEFGYAVLANTAML